MGAADFGEYNICSIPSITSTVITAQFTTCTALPKATLKLLHALKIINTQNAQGFWLLSAEVTASEPGKGSLNAERAKSGLQDVTRTAEFSPAVPNPDGGSTGQVAPFDVGRVRKIGSDDGFCSAHGQVARVTRSRVSQWAHNPGEGVWALVCRRTGEGTLLSFSTRHVPFLLELPPPRTIPLSIKNPGPSSLTLFAACKSLAPISTARSNRQLHASQLTSLLRRTLHRT